MLESLCSLEKNSLCQKAKNSNALGIRTMDDFEKLIDEYSTEYCLFLESTYGDHMLSEGGTIAIDRMFAGTSLQHQKMLDIGFGLGAAAFYLAEQYQAQVTGIELNPWMVEEATRRTPEQLRSRVNFVLYQQPPMLPFSDHSFDIVYSKGVLVHLQDKVPLFEEIHRILKPGGFLIIDDWLSPKKDQWGQRLQKLCEMESLTLYAQTEADYKDFLEKTGFSAIQIRAENNNYVQYNQDIVNRLNQPTVKASFTTEFGESAWQQAVEGYQLIADSIRDNELLIRWFKAISL
jgi:ubiquinone/menaquinone biosynthesis C-methylase UbiE